MAAIDRVMRAYASKYELNPTQAAFVRKELSEFIEQLKTRPWRDPPVAVQTATADGQGGMQVKASPSS
jgi:hypothetical protein